jgi:hypothetical protein
MMNRCFDVGARNRAAGLAMPLDMLVGEVDKDGAPLGSSSALRANVWKKCCDGDEGMASRALGC